MNTGTLGLLSLLDKLATFGLHGAVVGFVDDRRLVYRKLAPLNEFFKTSELRKVSPDLEMSAGFDPSANNPLSLALRVYVERIICISYRE